MSCLAALPLRPTTLLAAALLVTAAACAPPAPAREAPSAASPAPSQTAPVRADASSSARRALADTLIRLGTEDQAGREDMALAVTRGDTAFLKRMMAGDSARTERLREVVRAHGWPGRTLVGDSAAGAAWLILQHSPRVEVQREMLPLVEAAAARGEVPRQDLAMLVDRVRVDSGQPQLYGTQFDLAEGRMAAKPIADLPGLEARRAAVGLPPMAEYVRILAEMYRVPVTWPPAP